MSDKRDETSVEISVFPDSDHWWTIGPEHAAGGGSGVRITYRESGRDLVENDFIDIVANPTTLRTIADAINRIADHQEREG